MKPIFLLPAWLLAVLALSVRAQAPVPASSADPADAAHSTVAPAYHSAFNGYRSSNDMAQPMHPSGDAWRAANDAVKNADMHAGHMQTSSPAAGSPGDAHAAHADHQPDHQTDHQVDHQADHDMHSHHHGGGK